jgi:hypothetical protein
MAISGCFQHTVDTVYKRLICSVDLESDDRYFSEHVAELRDSLAPAVNNKNIILLDRFAYIVFKGPHT